MEIVVIVAVWLVAWYAYGRWRSARDQETKVAQFARLVSLLQVEMRSWEAEGASALVLMDKGRRWVKSNANVRPPLAEMTIKAALLPILHERLSNALGQREYNAFAEHEGREAMRLAATAGKPADALEQWRSDVEHRYEVASEKAKEVGVFHAKSVMDEA